MTVNYIVPSEKNVEPNRMNNFNSRIIVIQYNNTLLTTQKEITNTVKTI